MHGALGGLALTEAGEPVAGYWLVFLLCLGRNDIVTVGSAAVSLHVEGT